MRLTFYLNHYNTNKDTVMDEQNNIDKTREEAEEKLVNDAFQHLLDSYLSTRHRKKVDLITKAFHFAKQAHKGVRRLSGEPYIMHPIAVAQIAGTASRCCRGYRLYG